MSEAKLVATDAGFTSFVVNFQAFINDTTGGNRDIANLQTIANGDAKAGKESDPTRFDALLPGSGVVGTALAAKYKSFCGDLYGAISGMGKTLNGISADMIDAKGKLHNGETDALTAAQVMSLLSDVLGAGRPCLPSTRPARVADAHRRWGRGTSSTGGTPPDAETGKPGGPV